MALKPTIYRAKIELAHIEQNHYDTLNLTLALHPSENPERMMARLLAFCMNAGQEISFTKGLSTVEEPDIWAHTPDGRISLWIDMGEPSFDRVRKAVRIAERVKVYCFNTKSGSWWERERERIEPLGVSVVQLQWKGIQALAGLVTRTMALSVTVSDGVVYVSSDGGACEIPWTRLHTGKE